MVIPKFQDHNTKIGVFWFIAVGFGLTGLFVHKKQAKKDVVLQTTAFTVQYLLSKKNLLTKT